MAIASVGTLGSVGSKTANQASLVLTTTATLEAGNLGVIAIAVDNNGTTDADEGAVTGVVDSAGNTWSKAAEFTNGNAAAQAGATVSVWYKVVGTPLASGGTITASFSNSTSRDASGCHAWEFTKGAGTTIEVEGTPGTEAVDAADAGSLDVTTANIECLRFRAIASEQNIGGDGTLISTNTTSWTNITRAGTTGGSGVTNMGIGGEFIISTATNAASDPTFAATSDRASVYVAFKEVSAAVFIAGDDVTITRQSNVRASYW